MTLRALLFLNLILLPAGAAAPLMQSLGPGDTFSAAKLSGQEVQEIVAAIAQSAFDTPDSWTEELRIRRVDLGASAGLIAQGSKLLCGGTGNCQVFVLRKIGKKWLSLFGNEQAPIADGFQFGPGTTNGIKDFTITAHTSAQSQTRTNYKFDGTVYQRP